MTILQNILSDLTLRSTKEKDCINWHYWNGKSTLLDIIMTLLEPTSGKFTDGIDILKVNFINDWRNLPRMFQQNVYLTDLTFYENINLERH